LTATWIRKAVLPACIAGCVLGAAPAGGQCPSDDWEIYAATGDVAEIEVNGTIAWIGASGGVTRIDVSGISGGDPAQTRIDDSRGLVSSDVTSLATDGFGNVYVGTRRSGVSVFAADGRHLADLSSFDGLLWSDNVVTLDALGDTTAQWTVDAPGGQGSLRTVTGDRIVIASADSFSPAGLFEGGGLKSVFVERSGSGFAFFQERGLGAEFKDQLVRGLLVEPGVVWIGTANVGLWKRDETGPAPVKEPVLSTANGLLADIVRHINRGPHPTLGSVLWLGSGGGLQAWDGVNPPVAVDSLTGQTILDFTIAGNDLWVLAETPTFSRDLYRIDLTSPALLPQRQPRSTCVTDTLYVPREVAIDAAGRAVLGTREDSFTVLENGEWYCAPPLGPHSGTVADVTVGANGVLYFGTGDKNRAARANGLGWFDGSEWFSATPISDPQMLHVNVTEVATWPDSTVWFGTTLDANNGGLIHFFPATRAMERYTPNSPAGRITQGRNVWGLTLDRDSNLWVAYGQVGGGLSVVEYPSLLVTNFDFTTIFGGLTTLLRSVAADSRGRIWTTTTSDATRPGQVYVVDHRGTISDQSDDTYTQFNVANEIADIAPIPFLTIDSRDRIWLAGEKGLVVGQIGPDVGSSAGVTWTRVNPSGAQLGGRNPLPYTTGALDWDENLWLGTESVGIVRISRDLSTWTWFDGIAGCPLPDPAITGVHVDPVSRRVHVGTATGGIARINLSAIGGGQGAQLKARPAPNPWLPADAPLLTLTGIPTDEVTTLRIYTVTGELVHEAEDVRGAKTWDGRNVGAQLVESGVYLVTAVSTNGRVYEDKVAIIR
jgi:ligand-binding sensor domain-containing protein